MATLSERIDEALIGASQGPGAGNNQIIEINIRLDDLESVSHYHKNMTILNEIDSATCSINELTQENTVVFNGGSSTEVV